jgi:hypothetical protein
MKKARNRGATTFSGEQNWRLERTQTDLDTLVELGVIIPCGSDYRRTSFGHSIPAVPRDAMGDELIEWVEEQRHRLLVQIAFDRMLRSGIIVPTGETRDGAMVYKISSFGEKIYKSLRAAGIDVDLMTPDELEEYIAVHRRRGRLLANRAPRQLNLPI